MSEILDSVETEPAKTAEFSPSPPIEATTDCRGGFNKPARHRPNRSRPLNWEDISDIAAAREALSELASVPWEDAKKKLGL